MQLAEAKKAGDEDEWSPTLPSEDEYTSSLSAFSADSSAAAGFFLQPHREEWEPADSAATVPTFDELYDPDADEDDEVWVKEHLCQGKASAAVLSCPGCFTVIAVQCEADWTNRDRPEFHWNRWKTDRVMNCTVEHTSRGDVNGDATLNPPKRRRVESEVLTSSSPLDMKESSSDGFAVPVLHNTDVNSTNSGQNSSSASPSALPGGDGVGVVVESTVRCRTCRAQLGIQLLDGTFRLKCVLPSLSSS